MDPERSALHFTVSHFIFLTTPGRFDKISGKVTLDRTAKNGSMDVTIETSSVNTNHAERDKNLRSPNFFNVAKYPQAVYQSNAVNFTGDSPTSVEGHLTLLGITKPVTLKIETLKCDTPQADHKELCHSTASAQIADFGMTYAIPLVGDQIMLMFDLHASRD